MAKSKLIKNKKLRIKLYILLGVVVLLAIALLASNQMLKEQRSRMTPIAVDFQKNAKDWLSAPKELSEFLALARTDKVEAVGVSRDYVLFTLKDKSKYSTRVVCASPMTCEGVRDLSELSEKHKFTLVALTVSTLTPTELIFDTLGALLGLAFHLLIVGVAIMLFRGMNPSNSKESATLADKPDITFADVVGAAEAKQALQRVRSFLNAPETYVELGARVPRGVLLEGPPGTGKTLLARALAGECGVKFIHVDGSYFTSMFYGLGVTKVRQLFERARENAPCILFIDEIDGLGRRTTNSDMRGSEQESNRIINRVLTEMDGFDIRENIVVIGATNHASNVDAALRRPGRFDMVINVQLPTLQDRKQLFDLYLKKVKHDKAIDTLALARVGVGLSPADIENLVNKAASAAAEKGATETDEGHMFSALESHQLGGEVSNLKDIITPETRRRIAVHEAGHALVAHELGAGNVDRVSIEPRGQALGVTFVTRFTEEPLFGEPELRARAAMMLGGREAELLVLGNTSSGASDDLKRATELTLSMVGNYGFSKTFGLLSVEGVPKDLMDPQTQRELLHEARELLGAAQADCIRILTTQRAKFNALVALLDEQETVSGEPLRTVLGPKPPAPLAIATTVLEAA